jgi:tRNA pseudouridine38-40 synthase
MRGRLEKPVQYFIKVYYVGTRFFGSQYQPDLRTVEGDLIDALIAKKYIESMESGLFKRASRTDGGVHARCNIFTFISDKILYPMELNSRLKPDVGIWAYAISPEIESARFLAENREYIYYLPLSKLSDDFNYELMEKALEMLKGTHNFKYLCRLEPNKNPVKTLLETEVKKDNSFLRFRFVGDSFLWNQIRKSVRLLQDIGESKFVIEDLPDLLEGSDRLNNISIEKADPDGLILWNIKLPEKFEKLFQNDKRSLLKFSELFEDLTNSHLIQAKFHSDVAKSWLDYGNE